MSYSLVNCKFKNLTVKNNLNFFSPPQDQLEALPDLLTRTLTQHQERVDQRRNFLHPDTAATLNTTSTGGLQAVPAPSIGSPLFPHSR